VDETADRFWAWQKCDDGLLHVVRVYAPTTFSPEQAAGLEARAERIREDLNDDRAKRARTPDGIGQAVA
jgi:hypothetical protein